MRVLIVDDEPLARENVRLLLARHADVAAVRESATGRDALAQLAAFAPDLVLLDVRMPEVDGFQVASAIAPGGPLIVFVTAHDVHALQAFESEALDYLLKPFDDRRFDAMLARVRRRIGERAAARAPGAPGVDGAPRAYVDRLVVREVGRVRIVRVPDIRWIEAEGVYACVHHADTTTLVRTSMEALARALDPERFVRIHRSVIVARDQVESLRPAMHGDYVVVLTDGRELSLSRRRKAALAALMSPVAARPRPSGR